MKSCWHFFYLRNTAKISDIISVMLEEVPMYLLLLCWTAIVPYYNEVVPEKPSVSPKSTTARGLNGTSKKDHSCFISGSPLNPEL